MLFPKIWLWSLLAMYWTITNKKKNPCSILFIHVGLFILHNNISFWTLGDSHWTGRHLCCSIGRSTRQAEEALMLGFAARWVSFGFVNHQRVNLIYIPQKNVKQIWYHPKLSWPCGHETMKAQGRCVESWDQSWFTCLDRGDLDHVSALPGQNTPRH